MAALRQMVRSGFGKYRAVIAHSSSGTSRLSYRQISQLAEPNGNQAFPDTWALEKSLEAQGVPSKQAVTISSAVKEVLNGSLENMAAEMQKLRSLEAQGIPPKQAGAIMEVLNDGLESVAAKMQKTEMMQETNLSKFKSEVKSSQEHCFSLLQHETQKLRGDIEKMRSELRYDPPKGPLDVTAGQRPGLDVERGLGRIPDELARLTNRLEMLETNATGAIVLLFLICCLVYMCR